MGLIFALLIIAAAIYVFRGALKWIAVIVLIFIALGYISDLSGITADYDRENNNPIPPPLPGVNWIREHVMNEPPIIPTKDEDEEEPAEKPAPKAAPKKHHSPPKDSVEL